MGCGLPAKLNTNKFPSGPSLQTLLLSSVEAPSLGHRDRQTHGIFYQQPHEMLSNTAPRKLGMGFSAEIRKLTLCDSLCVSLSPHLHHVSMPFTLLLCVGTFSLHIYLCTTCVPHPHEGWKKA